MTPPYKFVDLHIKVWELGTQMMPS